MARRFGIRVVRTAVTRVRLLRARLIIVTTVTSLGLDATVIVILLVLLVLLVVTLAITNL